MNPDFQARNSPYQGLIPYTERDAVFFFGREKETRLIIANLFASPLTILYGPSGVGKSSVLRAGAVYQLAQRTDLSMIYNSVWKDDPLDRLKSALAFLPDLKSTPDTNLPLAEFLAECSARLKRRVMIVLDQFEEYFLYHSDVDDFTVQFSRAVIQVNTPVSFLISIREDALAKLDRFEGRIPILFDNYLRLEHLDDESARAAIEKPIEKYNELDLSGKEPIRIEPELVNAVIGQLMSGQVSLNRTGLGGVGGDDRKKIETPYLQLVLMRLWEEELRSGSHLLRVGTLNHLGGTEKIVRSHLDAVMKRLTGRQRLLASKIFQYLVTPSGTKIALNASDLSGFANSQVQPVQSLLQRLSEQDVRLLRPVDSKDKLEMSYEIFHDVLASPILDWRARYVRSRRFLWPAILFAVVSIPACGYILYSTSAAGLLSADGADPLGNITGAIIVGIGLSLLCMVPIGIGFFIGRRSARA